MVEINDTFTKRILKSLMILCLVELFGWTGNILAKNLMTWFQVPPSSALHDYVMSVVGYLLIISQALNGVIPLLRLPPSTRNTFLLEIESAMLLAPNISLR